MAARKKRATNKPVERNLRRKGMSKEKAAAVAAKFALNRRRLRKRKKR